MVRCPSWRKTARLKKVFRRNVWTTSDRSKGVYFWFASSLVPLLSCWVHPYFKTEDRSTAWVAALPTSINRNAQRTWATAISQSNRKLSLASHWFCSADQANKRIFAIRFQFLIGDKPRHYQRTNIGFEGKLGQRVDSSWQQSVSGGVSSQPKPRWTSQYRAGGPSQTNSDNKELLLDSHSTSSRSCIVWGLFSKGEIKSR